VVAATPVTVAGAWKADPADPDLYVSKHAYTAQQPRQLSFARRDLLRIGERMENGWWKAAQLDKATGATLAVGWVPSSYMRTLAAELQAAQAAQAGGVPATKVATGAEVASSMTVAVAAAAPAASATATEGKMEVVRVEFVRSEEEELGLSVVGGQETRDGKHVGIKIKNVRAWGRDTLVTINFYLFPQSCFLLCCFAVCRLPSSRRLAGRARCRPAMWFCVSTTSVLSGLCTTMPSKCCARRAASWSLPLRASKLLLPLPRLLRWKSSLPRLQARSRKRRQSLLSLLLSPHRTRLLLLLWWQTRREPVV
jgi:hypothetical protein